MSTPRVAQSSGQLTLDLGELTFMDSSGITLLIEISNSTGTLHLVHVPHPHPHVLELTGLLEHFGPDL